MSTTATIQSGTASLTLPVSGKAVPTLPAGRWTIDAPAGELSIVDQTDTRKKGWSKVGRLAFDTIEGRTYRIGWKGVGPASPLVLAVPVKPPVIDPVPVPAPVAFPLWRYGNFVGPIVGPKHVVAAEHVFVPTGTPIGRIVGSPLQTPDGVRTIIAAVTTDCPDVALLTLDQPVTSYVPVIEDGETWTTFAEAIRFPFGTAETIADPKSLNSYPNVPFVNPDLSSSSPIYVRTPKGWRVWAIALRTRGVGRPSSEWMVKATEPVPHEPRYGRVGIHAGSFTDPKLMRPILDAAGVNQVRLWPGLNGGGQNATRGMAAIEAFEANGYETTICIHPQEWILSVEDLKAPTTTFVARIVAAEGDVEWNESADVWTDEGKDSKGNDVPTKGKGTNRYRPVGDKRTVLRRMREKCIDPIAKAVGIARVNSCAVSLHIGLDVALADLQASGGLDGIAAMSVHSYFGGNATADQIRAAIATCRKFWPTGPIRCTEMNVKGAWSIEAFELHIRTLLECGVEFVCVHTGTPTPGVGYPIPWNDDGTVKTKSVVDVITRLNAEFPALVSR